jgi:hypothetical protein
MSEKHRAFHRAFAILVETANTNDGRFMVVRTTITIKREKKHIPFTPDRTPSCCFVTIRGLYGRRNPGTKDAG